MVDYVDEHIFDRSLKKYPIRIRSNTPYCTLFFWWTRNVCNAAGLEHFSKGDPLHGNKKLVVFIILCFYLIHKCN